MSPTDLLAEVIGVAGIIAGGLTVAVLALLERRDRRAGGPPPGGYAYRLLTTVDTRIVRHRSPRLCLAAARRYHGAPLRRLFRRT